MKKKKAFADGGEVKGIMRRTAEQLGAGGTGIVKKLAYPAAVAALSFILSATRGPMGTYPFGVAALCAAGGTLNTACAFAGAMLGTLTMERGDALRAHGLLRCRGDDKACNSNSPTLP